jgi:hypothetical protein
VTAYVAERATLADAASATTLVFTVSTNLTVGNHLILPCGWDTTSTINSIVDSRGNTWQTDVKDASGTSFERAILSARMATALQSGDTVTVTLSSSEARRMGTLQEFSGLAETGWLDQTIFAEATTGTALDSGLTAATAQADELVVGCFGAGTTDTAFTLGTNFSAFTTSELYAGQNFFNEYRIVSAIAQYAATASMTTSQRWGALCATYKAAPPAGRPSDLFLLGAA